MSNDRLTNPNVPGGLNATAETLVDVLRRRAERTPNRRVFMFLEGGEREADSLSFGQLDRRARAVAHRLTSLGMRGRQVLLLHPPGLDFIASFFGCLYAGAVAVPSYLSLLSARNLSQFRFIVEDADVKLILAAPDSLNSFRQILSEAGLTQAPGLLASDDVSDEEADGWSPVNIEPDALAYIQYTSGSTSSPRGVMIHHDNIMHNQRMIQSAFGQEEGMTGVSWLPHFHDMGLVGMVQQSVFTDMLAVLMSPLEFIRRPIKWLRAISKYRAYGSGAPNFAYDLCVERVTPEEAAALDLSCWKRAFTGSEPVRAETLERFAAKFSSCGFQAASFYPCYGLAEATLFVAGRAGFDPPVVRSVRLKDLEDGYFNEVAPSPANGSRRVVGCGLGWGDERILIVDPESLTPSPAGKVGEIWVSGSHVAKGYWKCAEEVRQAFHARLADTGEGPFLRTGDLGCVVDGELFITGRLKDLIILRGKNHYPHDIEMTVALSHPALRPNCGAAFSVDVGEQEELVVFQEVKGRTPPEQAVEIYAAIRQALAEEHAVKPHAIVLLKANTIPKTSSGKIRRSACRAEFLVNGFLQHAFS